MNFRKLFRESGPPRIRHWEPGKEPEKRQNDWAAFLPVSSFSTTQNPRGETNLYQIPYDSSYPCPVANSSNAMYQHPNFKHHLHNTFTNTDDQVYPGLKTTCLANEYTDRVATTVYDMFDPTFSSPSQNKATVKEARPTWKSRLFLKKGEKQEGQGQISPSRDCIDPFQFTDMLADGDGKNVLQRAVSALKKKKIVGRRRVSIDLVTVPSAARVSYLPDQESLLQRAQMQRRSLDGHFDSIKSRIKHRHEDDSVIEQPPHTNQVSFSHQNANFDKIAQYQCSPPSKDLQVTTFNDTQSNPPEMNGNAIPAKNSSTDDSRRDAPLLPLKLNHPTVYDESQNLPLHQQPSLYQMEPLRLYSPQRPEQHLGHKNVIQFAQHETSGQESWQQVRSKAVRKFEDWVVVSRSIL